mmetsp:Transcript_13147/g.31113  ORF Transcript_13147/g.31113 Transcript_13147/m.31113 type:complete len:163 (+) Transcript_13147:1753-2241(+)
MTIGIPQYTFPFRVKSAAAISTMGNIFSPPQPKRSLSTSSCKSPVSTEDQPKQDDNDSTTPKRGGGRPAAGGSSRPTHSRRSQQDHPSQQIDVTPRQTTTRSMSSPRHSGRKRKMPAYLLNQKLVGKTYIKSNQTGRNFVKVTTFRFKEMKNTKGLRFFVIF